MPQVTECANLPEPRKPTVVASVDPWFSFSVELDAADGLPLRGRVYEPAGRSEATLLALPGIGVPQRVFRHVGPWLASRGVRTVSVDYRGIGESNTRDGLATASLSAWATQDAVGALSYVRAEHEDAPVLLAHSFGGQALGMADELHGVRAAIFVGSQLGHPRHWEGLSRLKIELFWRALLPITTRLYDPIPKWVVGEPLPLGVAREWLRWGRSADWLMTYFTDADARYARFARPIMAYAISDDDIAPPRAVDDLLNRFTSAHVSRVDVTPASLGTPVIGHVGLFRPTNTEPIWTRWREFAIASCTP